MAITEKSLKILWSSAAGICSFTNCHTRLVQRNEVDGGSSIVGEMAHISGEKPGSNRYRAELSAQKRDSHLNLILLCPTHHTIIDKPENEALYTEDILLEMKRKHEANIADRVTQKIFGDKGEVAAALLGLLKINKSVFLQYGPHSEIARKNPWSEGAHSTWLTERLVTIVPTNRSIYQILESNIDLFSLKELEAIRKFQAHVRTYERWVQDEINYEGVTRFPHEFETMIENLANVSS